MNKSFEEKLKRIKDIIFKQDNFYLEEHCNKEIMSILTSYTKKEVNIIFSDQETLISISRRLAVETESGSMYSGRKSVAIIAIIEALFYCLKEEKIDITLNPSILIENLNLNYLNRINQLIKNKNNKPLQLEAYLSSLPEKKTTEQHNYLVEKLMDNLKTIENLFDCEKLNCAVSDYKTKKKINQFNYLKSLIKFIV